MWAVFVSMRVQVCRMPSLHPQCLVARTRFICSGTDSRGSVPVVLPALHNLSPLSRPLSFLSFALRSTSGPPGILDAQTLTAHRGITSIRAFMRVFTSEYMHIHYSFSCALGYVTDTIWHKYLAGVWRSLKSAPRLSTSYSLH